MSLDLQPNPLEHPRLRSIAVDLSDAAATQQAAHEATREPVTTVVHNAGMIRPALLAQASAADLAALSRLHLGAALILVQAALPAMRAARFGRIVLISSRAALGLATRSAYSATKVGLIGLARTWALELGPDGITVNAVAPGPIAGTAMFREVLPPGDPRIEALAASIPVRRLGQPEDVARAVLFLADAHSGFITGQTLFVCGGTSIGRSPVCNLIPGSPGLRPRGRKISRQRPPPLPLFAGEVETRSVEGEGAANIGSPLHPERYALRPLPRRAGEGGPTPHPFQSQQPRPTRATLPRAAAATPSR